MTTAQIAATSTGTVTKDAMNNDISCLRRPAATIWHSLGANTGRQYGGIVFRCVLDAEGGGATLRAMTHKAFELPEVANLFIAQVKARTNSHFPCDEDQDEEACVLPPLFFTSGVDRCFRLTQNLWLMAFAIGPIFPVVRIHTSASVLGDHLLSQNILELYETNIASGAPMSDPTLLQNVFDTARAGSST